MVKLSSKSPNLNLVARELALDAVLGLYTIGMAVHIPGVSNKLPDDLSRMWAPEPHACPLELVDIPEHSLPFRDANFWRITAPIHRRGLALALCVVEEILLQTAQRRGEDMNNPST